MDSQIAFPAFFGQLSAMKKLLFFAPFLAILLCSCEPKKEEVNKVQLVQEYIQALNDFDYQGIISKFEDSVRMKERVYESAFSKEDYYYHFQWDSTLKPTYKILEISEAEDGTVHMHVSKLEERIQFLNEEAIVTDEVVTFENGKIHDINIVNYVIFNEVEWINNRKDLVTWVNNNHPELNGFLHDQTREGAIHYLQALKYYKEANPE